MSYFSAHDELATDLATALRAGHLLSQRGRSTWENIELGSVRYRIGGRPDVFSILNTGNPDCLAPMVHEVKVTRADFKRDMRAGKWRRYDAYCEKMYFACPEGLIRPGELPPGVGLVTRGSRGWTIVRGAKATPWVLTHRDLCALIIKKQHLTPLQSKRN